MAFITSKLAEDAAVVGEIIGGGTDGRLTVDSLVWHPGCNGANSNETDSVKATEWGWGSTIFTVETWAQSKADVVKAIRITALCLNAV